MDRRYRRRWRGWARRVLKAKQRLSRHAVAPPLRHLPPLTRYWLTVCRCPDGVMFAPGPARRRRRLNWRTVAEWHEERPTERIMPGMASGATADIEFRKSRTTSTDSLKCYTTASSQDW